MDNSSLQVALYKAKKLFELIRETQSKDKYFFLRMWQKRNIRGKMILMI